MNNTLLYRLFALFALAISTYLIFQNLSSPAIRQWDEAIYANNALDMYDTGDPIVLRRNGEVTLYNTKPPLVIWLQTLSLHIFGVNEFAIRFPSALAGVLTCIMLLVFSIKTLKDIRVGIVGVLILGTTYGFVKQHVVKTGDLDAVLVMWITFYVLLFLHYLLTNPVRYKALFVMTGIGIAAAFLSKSVAGLIPVAGLFICALVMRKAKWILMRWHTWLVAGVVLVTCMGYYVVRESLAPGYLYRTHYSEYVRFYHNIMSWHNHPWYYYFWNWYRLDFFLPYVFWLPAAIVLGLLARKWKTPTMLLTVQLLVFIGIFSYPKVKLMWYDAPAYPWLALICAIGFIAIWDYVHEKLRTHERARTLMFGMALVLIFAIPVREMYERNAELYLPVDILEREGFFIRELYREKPDLKNYEVLMLAEQNAHYTQVEFYLNVYNRYKGYAIGLLKDTTGVHAGDTIAVCQEKQIEWLNKNFITEEIARDEIGCVLLRVNDR